MDLPSDPIDPLSPNVSDFGPFGILALFGDIFGCHKWAGGELLIALNG